MKTYHPTRSPGTMTADPSTERSPFARSCKQFVTITGLLESAEAMGLTHSELEEYLAANGRELLRRLLQDHLDAGEGGAAADGASTHGPTTC